MNEPPQKKAILLIDHGSRRDAANQMLEEVETLIQQIVGDAIFVTHAHMELAEPTISQGIEKCIQQGASYIIAHPYMLAPGRHATEDIPKMVAQALADHPQISFTITPPLGVHEGIAKAVIDRCGVA